MAVTKVDAQGFILDADGKPKVNSRNVKTGKKLMPKSTGAPRGPRKNHKAKTPPEGRKINVLGGARGERMRQLLEATHAMDEAAIIARARELVAEEDSRVKGPPDVPGTEPIALVGMRRDEMATLCYRLATRGLSLNQIADQMNLSASEVDKLTRRLSQTLRLDPKTLDVGFYMGESLAFYQEVRQMALMAASASGNSASLKLRALDLALNAEAQKNNFLTKIGVYSPTVVERIERWIIGTTDTMAAPPDEAGRVNIAAEIGRALARRSLRDPGPLPLEEEPEIEDVEFSEDEAAPRGSNG